MTFIPDTTSNTLMVGSKVKLLKTKHNKKGTFTKRHIFTVTSIRFNIYSLDLEVNLVDIDNNELNKVPSKDLQLIKPNKLLQKFLNLFKGEPDTSFQFPEIYISL